MPYPLGGNGGIMSDFADSEFEGLRRIKTSALDAIASGARAGFVYSFTGQHSVAAGEYLSLNMSFASEVLIHKVSVTSGMPVYLRNAHSAGTADGIFAPVNRHARSVNVTPASSQLYYAANPSGPVIDFGTTEIKPYAIADGDCLIAAVVQNTDTVSRTITISVTFEETSSRLHVFGLTASTELEPSTEMLDYG